MATGWGRHPCRLISGTCFRNGSFYGAVSRGITISSDLDEPTNELNLSVVPRDPSSDFIPEQVCPFPGMLKIEMGAATDTVAEYQVNSTDAANSDHPNFTREHVLVATKELMPLPVNDDVVVSLWMSELEGNGTNGWTDDGDFPFYVRVYFWDKDGTKITAGQTYEDHYALLLGPPISALDTWQKVSASFLPHQQRHSVLLSCWVWVQMAALQLALAFRICLDLKSKRVHRHNR